jgi:uncharacterized membrane protein YfcA
VVFGVILLYSAWRASRPLPEMVDTGTPDRLVAMLRLASDYPTPQGKVKYTPRHVPLGFGMMIVAGIVSGLLGIGSGALKVLAMDQAMRLPFKVSTTTSNFMIGVTAAASAGVYLHRGYIEPGLALPVMLGVLTGALAGAKLLTRAPTERLRTLFNLVLVVMAVQMLYKGLTGGI